MDNIEQFSFFSTVLQCIDKLADLRVIIMTVTSRQQTACTYMYQKLTYSSVITEMHDTSKVSECCNE